MVDESRDFTLNLRLLSSNHRSVAEVCRRMKLNRQQFNKYLAGASLPSAQNLRRIATFFGVEEGELFLRHHDFAKRVLAAPTSDNLPAGLQKFWDAQQAKRGATAAALKRYCGYYHLHFRSPAWPNRIIRSVAVIYQQDGRTYIRNLERLVRRDKPHLGNFVVKYQGIVLIEGDRIFTLDRPDMGDGTIALTVLYPSQRQHLVLLHGLVLAVTAGSGRQPYASRIVFSYLGKTPNLRDAIAACGVFSVDGTEIDADIVQAVSGDISPRDGTLVALEI